MLQHFRIEITLNIEVDNILYFVAGSTGLGRFCTFSKVSGFKMHLQVKYLETQQTLCVIRGGVGGQ